MSKPTNKPGWNPSDPSKIAEPSSTKKTTGWAAGEKPAAEHFNWLMKTVSEWIDYVDTAGIQGPQGEQGPAGPQGPAGAQGPAGSVDSSTLNTINSRISSLESSIGTTTVPSVSISFPYTSNAASNEYNAGNILPGNTKTINWANGSSQYLLLDADCSVIALTNAIAGNTYYLRVQQGGYGLKIITGWPSNVIWKNNVVPTISTGVWVVDVIGLYFDGTNYYGDITKGYYVPPVGTDTKNGYAALLTGQLNKFNLNQDGVFSVINAYFGLEYSSTGASIYPRVTAFTGQIARGTQSSVHGYRLGSIYADNTALNGKMHKMAFANDTLNSVGFFATGFQTSSTPMPRQVVQSALAAYKAFGGGGINPGTVRAYKLLFSTDVGSTTTTSLSNMLGTINAGNGQSGQNPVAFSSSTKGIFVGMTDGNYADGNKTTVNIQFSDETISLSSYSSIVIFGSSRVADGRYIKSGDGVSSSYHGYATTFIGTYNDVATSHSLYKTSLDTNVWSTVQATVSDGSQVRHGAVSGSFNGYFIGGDSASSLSNTRARKITYASDTYAIHAYSLSASANECAGFAG